MAVSGTPPRRYQPVADRRCKTCPAAAMTAWPWVSAQWLATSERLPSCGTDRPGRSSKPQSSHEPTACLPVRRRQPRVAALDDQLRIPTGGLLSAEPGPERALVA